MRVGAFCLAALLPAIAYSTEQSEPGTAATPAEHEAYAEGQLGRVRAIMNAAARRADYAPVRCVALVIGNAALGGKLLKHAHANARELEKNLRSSGFEVSTLTDLKGEAMAAAVDAFVAGLTRDSLALLYFSGYALQIDGRTVLLAADAGPGSTDEPSSPGVDLAALLHRMEEASTVRMVLVDACRDHPLAVQYGPQSRTLTPLEPQAGTLIQYSNLDGDPAPACSTYGAEYALRLALLLRVPGVPVDSLLPMANAMTSIRTGGAVMPTDAGRLRQNVRLVPPRPKSSVLDPKEGLMRLQ